MPDLPTLGLFAVCAAWAVAFLLLPPAGGEEDAPRVLRWLAVKLLLLLVYVLILLAWVFWRGR